MQKREQNDFEQELKQSSKPEYIHPSDFLQQTFYSWQTEKIQKISAQLSQEYFFTNSAKIQKAIFNLLFPPEKTQERKKRYKLPPEKKFIAFAPCPETNIALWRGVVSNISQTGVCLHSNTQIPSQLITKLEFSNNREMQIISLDTFINKLTGENGYNINSSHVKGEYGIIARLVKERFEEKNGKTLFIYHLQLLESTSQYDQMLKKYIDSVENPLPQKKGITPEEKETFLKQITQDLEALDDWIFEF